MAYMASGDPTDASLITVRRESRTWLEQEEQKYANWTYAIAAGAAFHGVLVPNDDTTRSTFWLGSAGTGLEMCVAAHGTSWSFGKERALGRMTDWLSKDPVLDMPISRSKIRQTELDDIKFSIDDFAARGDDGSSRPCLPML